MLVYIQRFFLILFSTTLFFCTDKPPDVRISNQSKLSVDVFFKIIDCSCPSVSFINVYPYSETIYKECSVNKYEVQIKTIDVEEENSITLQTEKNKRYQLNIDSVLNCRIDVFEK
jgi:hypothetical protein